MPAVRSFDTSFRSTVADARRGKTETYTEYLDQDRFSSDQHAAAYVKLMRARYSTLNIAIVVAVGLSAYEFLLRNEGKLFSRPVSIVRVVFVPPPAGAAALASPANVVDASARINPLATIELALELHPAAKRLVVVTGASAWDRLWEQRLRHDAATLHERLEVEFLAGLPTADLQARLAKLGRDAIVFTPGFFADGAGKVYTPGDAMRAITAHASAPAYNPFPLIYGNGTVGGVVTTFESIGWRAGSVVNMLLAGKSLDEAASLPALPAIPTLDARVARRWGLEGRSFPPGTVLQFAEPTFLERYWIAIAAGIAAVLLQSFLIVVLLVQRRGRQRAAIALENSENRVGLAVRAAKLTPWTCDISEVPPRLLFQARRRGEPLGEEAQTLAGSVLHPADRASLKAAADRAIAGHGDLDMECRVLRADGETRWVSIRGMAEDGDRPRVLGVGLDITERKNADLQTARDRAALRHLTRVSLLGQLLASITHELSQPLTTILNNAEAARKMVSREKIDIAELREICNDIVAEDERAAGVIRRLRLLFKRGVPETTPLQLSDLASETLELMRAELQMRHVAVTVYLAAELPPIEGDRVELQQVLINLIVNAADAMEVVPIGARMLAIRTEATPNGQRMCVGDSGPGISPSDLKSIFEPFWTTKPRGMGMGLAICRTIMTAHRGTLNAWNSPQGGATFCLGLPLRREAGEAA